MYNSANPPLVLLLGGLFIGITCCTAFVVNLKQLLKEWSKNRSSRNLANLRGFPILFPFLGIGLGICIFLASCLEVFAFSETFAYGFSIPLTALMAGLVWYQLTRLFNQLEQKGLRGIDLDDLSLGKIIPQQNPPEN
ncbi:MULTISPECIES: hypothetical protein [Planktothrix]|jgi:hypothetical protein|uniref:Uncharacterized protein n=2 Tax=Planktothrix TaxID=54304 RepID=A0A4P5ZIH4_PLAAG|nr:MULTISPECIES: hypothetical protein [Planktothrix]CAD5967857.1 hypothetical protein NO108_03956 [Planktothrix rubescens]CAC5343102.1 conserved membrane hypothetical protein [Planktothrix rubescens NIVA-CYA 18]CAD5976676.1 hypothetical protein PCC7821_04190 [Planktothrix rubescens NIVA-CYA 18]CAH2574736.1 hypothetical protein PRNO82_04100 [Planktothrix rubescens]GDZ95203.1 hypothetical protein PA905_34420 [Planktothrix agardhii CCAP 1459/11A]